MTVKYIANRAGDITLPWEPGLLEWLIARYPHRALSGNGQCRRLQFFN